MAENIWQKLSKPIFVLAPMADVTDAAFRQIINKYSRVTIDGVKQGGPDIFFTEFTSADGLMHPTGREKLKRELYFTPTEKPIIAQLFSSHPDKLKSACEYVASLGFDGIDINMGCPDKSIEKQGAGASLIKNPKLAQDLILAAKAGAGGLPVSVKTRIGYNKNEVDTWVKTLLAVEPSAITFHLRTRKEMSKVSAHWEEMNKIVDLAKGSQTLILGNGDVADLAEARAKVAEYNIDGVMLGRAIYGNPWLFAETIPTLQERLLVLVEHTKLFEDLFGETATNQKLFNGHTKSFAIMKKHFKAYVNGFEGALELRTKLMDTEKAEEVESLVETFLAKQ